MKKFRPVILMSIISATILSVVSFWVPEFEGAFLGFVILAGCSLVWIQKENITHKFLSKLIMGSVLFGFLTWFLIFLRMYILSHLIYDAPLPFRELWDKDYMMMWLAIMIVSFLGGLVGVAVKGFYALYKDKLNKVIVFIGPLFVLLSSLAVYKIKIGGTIMSSFHGWPYPFWIHQIKDVVDGLAIDKWIFSPGSIRHYIVFNYLLYLAIFVLIYCLIKFVNKKFKKSINSTFLLFGLLVLMIIIFTSFLSVEKSYIQHQISGAKYCEVESDCEIIANISPFSCAIVVNKNNADKILKLVNSFPSTGELQCSGKEKAFCMQNKCRISIDQTSNKTYWEILKWFIGNCEVSSIMQAHSLEVTAILKNGKVIKAKEPEIDDIFDIIAESKDKCGDIIVATE